MQRRTTNSRAEKPSQKRTSERSSEKPSRKQTGERPTDKSPVKRTDRRPERLTEKPSGRAATPKRGTQSAGKDTRKRRTEEKSLIRLNKFLADAGVASRRKADEMIAEGIVRVNRKVVTEVGTKVHLSDLVTVNGEPVNAEKHLTYILLNKPKDYITTTSDELGRKTVMDIVHSSQRIYPIGRLDRQTTGVLLFTNDGELANRLMHPSYEVMRVYKVNINKPLTNEDARKIAEGVELEDGKTSPCNIYFESGNPMMIILEISEGKNREVRRIFESLGYDVVKLDRKVYAGIMVSGMKRGEFRHLTRQEVRQLEALVGLENRYGRS